MDIGELLISLVLTIFVYLFFPSIYLHAVGKVSKRRGRKIALLNSIICATLFMIVRGLISGWNTAATSFAPAVLYYFIVKAGLVDKDIEDEVEIEDTNDEIPKSKPKKVKKQRMGLKLLKLNSGKIVWASIAEISGEVINFRDCKNNLPYDNYIKLTTIYELFQEEDDDVYFINKEIYKIVTAMMRVIVEENAGVILTIEGKVNSVERDKSKLPSTPVAAINAIGEIKNVIEELANKLYDEVEEKKSEFEDEFDNLHDL